LVVRGGRISVCRSPLTQVAQHARRPNSGIWGRESRRRGRREGGWEECPT